MKYIRIASDLHLEGFTGLTATVLVNEFLSPDERDEESILVLAGDISSKPTQLLEFLNECTKRFEHVVYVPGNHEFYHHNIDTYPSKLLAEMNTQIAKGEQFRGLHAALEYFKCETIAGVRFVFGTMWGDGGRTAVDQFATERGLYDFVHIRKGDGSETFKVSDMQARFADSKRQLRDYLEAPFDGKTVVVTHHLPSRRLVSERFLTRDGSDGINGGFVGDCDNIICTLEPNLWIHGHTHDTIDTHLWKTRVVCNPAGYRGEWASRYNTFMTTTGAGKVIVAPKFVAIEEL